MDGELDLERIMTKLDAELETTKKLMRSQNGGVASIRDQWSRKGSTSDDGETPKPSGRRPLDVNIVVNASSGSVRDRWKKIAETNESESAAAPLEKPRRKKQDNDFQSVMRRIQHSDGDVARFNPNFGKNGKDKNGKEGKTPDKIMIDPFARLENLEIDKEKMKKQFEEDEKKREDRKKEREALLKKIEEDSAKRRKAEQEETRKRLEADKKRREIAREEEATINAVNGEPKRNFVIPKRPHDQVSNIMKAKEENTKTKGELILDKKAVLAKRIEPLNTEGFTHEELLEKAKELYDAIYELESEKIDFEKILERQQYDIMELKERANQMQVCTSPSLKPKPLALPLKSGLGVGRLSERFSSGAPPKVQVSGPHQNDPYTRLNNDGKSFTDKFKMFETMAKK